METDGDRRQAGDNPQLVPLLEALRAARGRAGQPRVRFHLLADKAYSHPSTCAQLRRRRIRHTIPERDDQVEHRKRQGSRGGRPPTFDKTATPSATPSSAASDG